MCRLRYVLNKAADCELLDESPMRRLKFLRENNARLRRLDTKKKFSLLVLGLELADCLYARENRLAAAAEQKVLPWFLRGNLFHALARI